MDLKEVRAEYLSKKFAIDIISSVPFILSYAFVENFPTFATFAHFLTLLRFVQIVDLTRYLRNTMEYLNFDDNAINVTTTGLVFLIFCNFIVGLQFIPIICASFLYDEAVEPYWFEGSIDDLTPATHYLFCVYRTMFTLLGTGLNRFWISGIIDQAYMTFTLIVGCFLRLFLMAKILEKLTAITSSKLKFTESVNELDVYLYQKELPYSIKLKIKKMHDYYYQKNYFDEREVLTTVTGGLYNDILLYNSRVLLENLEYFAAIPQPAFICIAARLRWEAIEGGDYLFHVGETVTSMYFTIAGTLVVHTPSDLEMEHLEDGTYTGELSFVLSGDTKVLTVMALTMCELYR